MLHFSDTLIVTVILFTILYLYLTRHFDYWKLRNVPHKKPLVLVGNLLDVVLGKVSTGRLLALLYNDFTGPYFGFYGMDTPFLVIKDRSILKRMLIKDFEIFSERSFFHDENIDPIFSNVLFTMKKAVWAPLRKKLTPLFTSGNIKAMLPLIIESGANMCKYLDGKLDHELDTKELAGKYTIDVITSCALGIEANSFLNENSEFRVAGRKFFKEKFTRAISTLSYIFAHTLVKLLRLKFVEPEGADFFRHVFAQTLERRENTGIHRNDLIDTIMLLKQRNTADSDDFKFYGDRLAAQAIIFYVAGNEPMSSTISFTLLELAVNPHVQDTLRQEIAHAVATHHGITYEAVQDMKYMHMVVSETLRKYPFTPFLHRRCLQNYVIPETGLVVERGVGILIPSDGFHWDSKYFPEPEKFDPERFRDTNKENIIKYTYFPFGVGPRSCIGNRFALLTTKLGILKILMNYQIERTINTKYPLKFGRSFIIQPLGGVPLVFRKL